MNENKIANQEEKKSLRLSIYVFLMGLLGTAATLISVEKYLLALICVSVGGVCALIITLIVKFINYLLSK